MDAYIIDGYRSPVGKAPKGVFRFTRPDDLAADVIKHLLSKVPALDPTRVDDIIVGNSVPEAEQGMQMARYISLLALGKTVPGVTINRYCGSGVESIAMAVGKISAGMADCIIAGGTESMSMVPTMGYKTALNFEIASTTPDYYIGMGLTAEQVANEYKVSREDQDVFSYNSHQKALAAQIRVMRRGHFFCWPNHFESDELEAAFLRVLELLAQLLRRLGVHLHVHARRTQNARDALVIAHPGGVEADHQHLGGRCLAGEERVLDFFHCGDEAIHAERCADAR